jgi:hypothetical protein
VGRHEGGETRRETSLAGLYHELFPSGIKASAIGLLPTEWVLFPGSRKFKSENSSPLKISINESFKGPQSVDGEGILREKISYTVLRKK